MERGNTIACKPAVNTGHDRAGVYDGASIVENVNRGAIDQTTVDGATAQIIQRRNPAAVIVIYPGYRASDEAAIVQFGNQRSTGTTVVVNATICAIDGGAAVVVERTYRAAVAVIDTMAITAQTAVATAYRAAVVQHTNLPALILYPGIHLSTGNHSAAAIAEIGDRSLVADTVKTIRRCLYRSKIDDTAYPATATVVEPVVTASDRCTAGIIDRA